MPKITGLFILLCFFFLAARDASSIGAVVLLKGVVQENPRGLPVGAKMTFVDSKGKKTSCKSNAADGGFQHVLASGETYKLLISGHLLDEHAGTLEIPPHDEYVEITQNFRVKKLEPGLELYHFKAFEPNDSTLVDSLLAPFDELREIMRNNATMSVSINISSADSYLKKKTVKVQIPSKSRRKKYKFVKLTTEDRMKQLLDARLRAMEEYVSGMKVRKSNVKVDTTLEINEPPQKRRRRSKKKEPEKIVPNVKITVSGFRKM